MVDNLRGEVAKAVQGMQNISGFVTKSILNKPSSMFFLGLWKMGNDLQSHKHRIWFVVVKYPIMVQHVGKDNVLMCHSLPQWGKDASNICGKLQAFSMISEPQQGR